MDLGKLIAVDTETMGLNINRDRLCVIQLSSGNGDCHIVQVRPPYDAPNLKSLLSNPAIMKIFHFARFDIAMLSKHLNIRCEPVYCTRTVSKLCRTNTERHGLKDLCKAYLGVDLSKQQQTSDWAAANLTEEQLSYAAADVLYLHALKSKLDSLIDREGRRSLVEACFRFLPDRAELDIAGWDDEDIFAH